MEYNQEACDSIRRFESIVESVQIPSEVSRKLLSILEAIEYQVEEGKFPEAVVIKLKEAILQWTSSLPAETRQILDTALELCIARVLRTKH